MQQLAPDLFTAEAPLRFGGLEVGCRMTVARLPDESLWVHSPIPLDDALCREVEALGPVRALLAPNRLHHLYVGDWQAAFPDATLHVAPGLETKRPDLKITAVLGDVAPAEWGDALDQVFFAGYPFANEVVFFHAPSATLIATDIAFYVRDRHPWLTRWAFRLLGSFDQLAPSLIERVMIRDRLAFRRSLDRVLAWPFERVVVSHGDVLESGGREALRSGYAWLPA
ncbi:MAG: DUF4336 domain-containing protein [Myxococcota bacterium]